jgi:ligand-binding sensor protein
MKFVFTSVHAERSSHDRRGLEMKYHISELIDAEKVQKLMKRFHEMTKIPCTLIDPEGNILRVNGNNFLSSGWENICSNFHRKHPESLAKCIESDTILSKQIIANKKYSLYRCPNGLVDAAIPIFLDREHVVSLFTGQFFLEAPDIGFFKNKLIITVMTSKNIWRLCVKCLFLIGGQWNKGYYF